MMTKMKMKMENKFSYKYLLALLFVAANNGFVRLVESASVRLTKQCFNIGETITIRFNSVQGEGIFVGLYPRADVPNLQILPELESPSLLDWVLTCGERENCENWPARGLVQLSTTGLEESDYFIAVSGDRSGLTPQGTTRTFHVGDCSTFFSVPVSSPTRPITLGPTQPTVVASLTDIPTPQPVPIPVPVQVASDSVLVVSDAINSVIIDARIQIENLIRADGDLTPKVSSVQRMIIISVCCNCYVNPLTLYLPFYYAMMLSFFA